MTEKSGHDQAQDSNSKKGDEPSDQGGAAESEKSDTVSDDKEGGEKSGDDKDNEFSGDDGDGDGDKQDDGKPPIYKRPLFWVVAIVVLAVLIVGGTLYWLHARRFVSTDDAFVDAHVVRLSPEVAGRLVQVASADNRHVEAGALLAVVEPSGPEAQLQQARAQVLEADAGIEQAQAQVDQAIAQRRQAAADARAPEADAIKAARDYARYVELVKIDKAAVAATQVDQARAAAESTAAQAAAARRQVDTADAAVCVELRGVKAARARREAATAQVAQAGVTIGNLRLRAPVAGQVVDRMVNLGSYVSPGQQIMALVPDAMWVTANFKETQLQHMRRGQHVDITVDAFPDVKFEGHVDSIQRGAGQAFQLLPPQNATGNYVKVVQRVPVRILFDRPDPRRWSIGPGMSVTPRVTVR